MVPVSGNPFGVVSTHGGAWSFVSTLSGTVAVVDDRGRRPRVVREITLPGDTLAGDVLTNDGRYLLIADGSGAAVLDVGRLERGAPHAVLGKLAVDARSTSLTLDSAIEVSVSPTTDSPSSRSNPRMRSPSSTSTAPSRPDSSDRPLSARSRSA